MAGNNKEIINRIVAGIGTMKKLAPKAADGFLAFLAGAFRAAVAHGTALAEGGRGPQQQKYREGKQARLHFGTVVIPTPRCRIR